MSALSTSNQTYENTEEKSLLKSGVWIHAHFKGIFMNHEIADSYSFYETGRRLKKLFEIRFISFLIGTNLILPSNYKKKQEKLKTFLKNIRLRLRLYISG